MIELLETNRMSHFLPFYDDFFIQKFNFKEGIFHSGVICGRELCKGDGITKIGIVVHISLFRCANLILSC